MSKTDAPHVITTDPIPTRDVVTELPSQNGHPEQVAAPPPPPPAPPTPPVDHLHLHRRFEHLLSVLEQTGGIPSDERERIRRVP
jgi:hypothetical protein